MRVALTSEQRKLALSLGANVLTRIPSAVGIVLFLPLVQTGLGTADYAALLAALALGGVATFLFGGIGIAARRMVGTSYAAGDRQGEADAVWTVTAAGLIFALAMVPFLIGYAVWSGTRPVFLLVALLPLASAVANIFDNVRSAYNEHYVTATIQLGVQILLYALGLTVPAFTRTAFLAALVIQAGGLVASVAGLALLLRSRGYLRGGSVRGVRAVMAQAGGIGIAEGLLMSGLGVAVVLVNTNAAAGDSAWFGTSVRLFQTFLAPVLLLLVPLSSYLRLGWATRTPAGQRGMMTLTAGASLIYAVAVAVALYVASRLYIGGVLHLTPPDRAGFAGALFILFGAIILYKSYTSIAFLLLDLRHLMLGTLAVVALGAATAAAIMLGQDMLAVVIGYALTTAIGIAVLVGDSLRRFRRETAVAIKA